MKNESKRHILINHGVTFLETEMTLQDIELILSCLNDKIRTMDCDSKEYKNAISLYESIDEEHTILIDTIEACRKQEEGYQEDEDKYKYDF